MATPQERMTADIKGLLVGARAAAGRPLDRLWALYEHQGGSAGLRTFRSWFYVNERSIPNAVEFDILAEVLNMIQEEVVLPRLFPDGFDGKRYFPPYPSDQPFSLSVMPFPRQEDLISALG